MPLPAPRAPLTLQLPAVGTAADERDAYAELLAARRAARRVLDVLSAYERDHRDRPLSPGHRPPTLDG